MGICVSHDPHYHHHPHWHPGSRVEMPVLHLHRNQHHEWSPPRPPTPARLGSAVGEHDDGRQDENEHYYDDESVKSILGRTAISEVPSGEVVDKEEERKEKDGVGNDEERYQKERERQEEEELEWGILQMQAEMGLRNKEVENWCDRVVADSGIVNRG